MEAPVAGRGNAGRVHWMQAALALAIALVAVAYTAGVVAGATKQHIGGHPLRTELRRLRSIGLIEMRAAHHVGEMTDGTTFDLAGYVQLTAQGRWWADKSRELVEAEQG